MKILGRLEDGRETLRPRGTVEVTCSCGWTFWIDPLDPRLPDGPFPCSTCRGEDGPSEKEGEDHG